jgi:hypothetical protein
MRGAGLLRRVEASSLNVTSLIQCRTSMRSLNALFRSEHALAGCNLLSMITVRYKRTPCVIAVNRCSGSPALVAPRTVLPSKAMIR